MPTATGPWTEQLVVRNKTTGDQVATATVTQAAGQVLSAGASEQRSVQITWPTGGDSTGDFSFNVTTDTLNQVVQAPPSGSSSLNNSVELDVLSTPQLTVTGLQAAPGSTPQAGGQLTLQWTDTNTGNVKTPNAWSDLVTIYNSNGQQIADVAVPGGTAVWRPRTRRHAGAKRHGDAAAGDGGRGRAAGDGDRE